MTEAKPVFTIEAVDDATTGQALPRLTSAGAEAMQGQTILVGLDGHELLRATLGAAPAVESVVACSRLLQMEQALLTFRDGSGRDLADAADWVLRGDFFAALRIGPEDFLDRVQLHHSRIRSPFLLEIAARSFYLRHAAAPFFLRAAALTILGHRLLERPPEALTAADLASIAWLLAEAGRVVPEGAALIEATEAAGQAVDWRHARWTISLATVAGHLALYDEGYDRALDFLNQATRQTRHVATARVSGLNLVVCAFAEGLVAHLLGRPAEAEAALRGGVASVKAIVAAQNLFENVWVMGDLEHVLIAARQCFIALVRLGLLVPPTDPPVIDATTQIAIVQVRSRLFRIVKSGRVPRLAAMLRDSGGT